MIVIVDFYQGDIVKIAEFKDKFVIVSKDAFIAAGNDIKNLHLIRNYISV